jgi:sugar lactone lactonase YvrE
LDQSVVQELGEAAEILNTYPVGLGPETPWELGGQGPVDLAHDGTNLWVATNWRHVVSKMSPSGEMLGEFPVGAWPMAVAYDGATIWIASYRDDKVVRLDLDGKEIGAFPTGKNPIAIEAIAGSIWIANFGDNSLTKITS